MANNNRNSANGRTGGIVLLFLGAIGLYFLYHALPVLLSLATNILSLALMLLLIAAVLFIFLNPRVRFGIGSLINSIFRGKN